MQNFHNKSLVARNVGLTRATTIVPYLTPEEVRQLLKLPEKANGTPSSSASYFRPVFAYPKPSS